MNAIPLPLLLIALAVAGVYLFLVALSIKRTELDRRNWLYPAWLTTLALSCITFDPRIQAWIDLPETLFLVLLLYHVGRVQQEQNDRDLALTTVGYVLTYLAAATHTGRFGPETLLPALNLTLVVHASILYLRSPRAHRWAIRNLVLAVYLIAGFQGLGQLAALLGHPLPDLRPFQPLAYLAALPFVVLFATRTPSLGIKLHISRHAGHLAMLLIVTLATVQGLYLLHHYTGLLSRQVYQPAWAYLFLAALVPLLGLMVVKRNNIKSFINQHFYNFKYDYRESWLEVTKKLSTALDDDDRLRRTTVDIYRDIFDCPAGALWLRHGNVYLLETTTGMHFPVGQIPSDDQAIRFLADWQWVIDLNELERGEDLYPGLAPPEWLIHARPRPWLLLPLLVNAELFGFVVLGPSRSRRSIDWEDIDLAKTVGRQVAISLLQAQSARALAEAKQFGAYTKLATYVIHDLKNIISQLDLINRNYHRYRDNPEFLDDMHQTLAHTVEKMRELLARLNATTPPTEPKAPEPLDLRDLMAALEHRYRKTVRPGIELQFSSPDTKTVVRAERGKLLSVLGNIINNAIEAIPDEGRVNVRAQNEGGRVLITIEDDGVGMSEEFIRTRLFKPFETTKGIEGMGIGMYEAKEYVESLGGHIQAQSREGEGTLITVSLPQSP